MSKARKEAEGTLLWDCFTNWSQTLEKTSQDSPSKKNQG